VLASTNCVNNPFQALNIPHSSILAVESGKLRADNAS